MSPDKYTSLMAMVPFVAALDVNGQQLKWPEGFGVNWIRIVEAVIIAIVTGALSVYGSFRVLESKFDIVSINQEKNIARLEQKMDERDARFDKKLDEQSIMLIQHLMGTRAVK
jgi:hypothetical protein